MQKEETYKCEICGKTVKTSSKKIPMCCGRPMKKLPLEVCLQPAHAEHARPMADEDACDEGRAGHL
jgi:endogenous inhibitor of DNA gyrase (YacG/DUF329 family)